VAALHANAGSFRDRGGRIYHVDGRILRSVTSLATDDYRFTRDSGLVQKLIKKGWLVGESEVDASVLEHAGDAAEVVLEHPAVPFVSWPYEWPFSALKAAALLHLDIQLEALDADVALSDASAYNIQFQGHRPVFIDGLSFRRYRDGEFWTGHRQFCEQFLNPLLLQAKTGIPYQPWFRGSLEGIPATLLSQLLPWYRKLSWNMLSQVWLQAGLQAGSSEQQAKERMQSRKLSRRAYREILLGLRRWVDSLTPRRRRKTVWQDYTKTHSYQDEEAAAKQAFVARFVERYAPACLIDCGCNTGDFSLLALGAGARRVIGVDFDEAAVDIAYRRAAEGSYDFLPLVVDATNPTPSQGWQQSERLGFDQRLNADALLALALVHHLIIGKNLRLEDVIAWLISLSPRGVIEFIPKPDPMVQRLLALRDDIFTDYSEDNFMACIRRHAEILETETVSAHGRKLIAYERHERR